LAPRRCRPDGWKLAYVGPAAAGDRAQERQLAVLAVDGERADGSLLVVADAIGLIE
jgi:hypothetical protein